LGSKCSTEHPRLHGTLLVNYAPPRFPSFSMRFPTSCGVNHVNSHGRGATMNGCIRQFLLGALAIYFVLYATSVVSLSCKYYLCRRSKVVRGDIKGLQEGSDEGWCLQNGAVPSRQRGILTGAVFVRITHL